MSTTTKRIWQCLRKWSPPALDCFKINCDANLQVMGWWSLEAIVRDATGLAMALASWRMKGSDDVKFAEAFALYHSTDLALACGFKRVVFEVDIERLVSLVQNDLIEDRSYLGQLLYEIQSLQTQFDTCSLTYIDRSCNGLTHKMAQIAHSNPNNVWIEEVPFKANEVYIHEILH